MAESCSTNIFNDCIQNSILPIILNHACVLPIHKIGPTTQLSYYRPMLVTLTFAKLFWENSDYADDALHQPKQSVKQRAI